MRIRRLAILLMCLAPALPAAAAEKPYRVSLIGDGFDGTAWHTGVLIELAPGWKTYWRMPGEAGVSPEFTWTATPEAQAAAAFPAPARYADASGETVGYEGEALFPVTVTPGQGASQVDLRLKLFFAVCKDICIPANAEAAIALGPMVRDPEGTARVEEAIDRLPRSGEAITAATLASEGGKPVLRLALQQRPEDIFVETATTAYFRKPAFSADGREALLAIDNVSDTARLKGAALRFTYSIAGTAYEQSLSLP